MKSKIFAIVSRFGTGRASGTLMLTLALVAGFFSSTLADDDLAVREEAAMKAAVARVAPSVVRIETLGGRETVGDLLVGTGPTTGLIVSSDGFIISSAFNFISKPTQILVYLADGTRLPAQLAGRDDSRMLVLLKVPTAALDPKKQLPVPEAAPLAEIQVGQWAVAIGRVFDGSQTNLSVGIISAVNRVWGKAVQTDAKISPANYGGPLVDLHGRVLGVLVPMSPQETGEVAGVEWYDSGIGFAVPLVQINRVLARLEHGEELHPGLLGISMCAGDPYTMEPIIAVCHPKSPASDAGLKAGDKIIEIEGVKVASQSEFAHQLGPRYAGDKISLVVLRGKDRVEASLDLAAKLLPYVHPFLGVLPRRDGEQMKLAAGEGGEKDQSKPDADSSKVAPVASGVVVRDVYPNSPAATAGIQPGDRIVSLAGQGVADRFKLQQQVASLEPLKPAKVEIERDGKRQTLELKLATLPEAVPANLSPARDASPPADEAQASVGKIEIKIPEAPNNCLAYVPETYNSHVPYGLIVWLHPAGGYKADELVQRWKPLCDANDMILLAPKSADAARWQRTEVEFIRKAIDDVAQKYHVDPTRIVAVGEDAGGSLAYLLASQQPDLIRGVAAINAPMPPGMRPPENDPVQRLAFFAASAKRSPPSIAAGIKLLRESKFPVTELDLGPIKRPLTDDEWKQLVRWIDTLDRS